MPLQRRLPKRGFVNIFRQEIEIVNVAALEDFEAGTTVDIDALKKAGKVRSSAKRVKVLGNGDLPKKLHVKADAFSGSAKEKIEKAGGSAESAGPAAADKAE